MIDIRRLAFIGGGNMAAALIGGLIRQGLPSGRIVVADPSAEQLERLVRSYGVLRAPDNASAAAGAEAVILAVKPQQMRPVCLALKPTSRRQAACSSRSPPAYRMRRCRAGSARTSPSCAPCRTGRR